MKGLIKIIEKFRAEKPLCTFLITKYPLRGAWNIDYESNCAYLKVKGSILFSYANLVHDF